MDRGTLAPVSAPHAASTSVVIARLARGRHRCRSATAIATSSPITTRAPAIAGPLSGAWMASPWRLVRSTRGGTPSARRPWRMPAPSPRLGRSSAPPNDSIRPTFPVPATWSMITGSQATRDTAAAPPSHHQRSCGGPAPPPSGSPAARRQPSQVNARPTATHAAVPAATPTTARCCWHTNASASANSGSSRRSPSSTAHPRTTTATSGIPPMFELIGSVSMAMPCAHARPESASTPARPTSGPARRKTTHAATRIAERLNNPAPTSIPRSEPKSSTAGTSR